MEDNEGRSESGERKGKEAPGGGSVRRSFSSFCIRRLSRAACAMSPELRSVSTFQIGNSDCVHLWLWNFKTILGFQMGFSAGC